MAVTTVGWFIDMPIVPGRPPLRRSAAQLPGPRRGRSVSRVPIVSPLVAAVLALGLVLVAAGAALAADPPRISGEVTDPVGVLDAGATADAEAAIRQLQDATGVQLFVVFVDTTGGRTISEFVDQTRQKNSLGRSDALLAVAVDDRVYQLYLDASLGLSEAAVDGIATRDIEPSLRDGDWGGAVVRGAAALEAALTGAASSAIPTSGPTAVPSSPPATASPAGAGSTGGGPGGPSPLTVLVGAILIVLGLLIVLRAVGRIRLGARSPEERDILTGDLARRANRLLVGTDEAIRDSEQELGFAEAQFGADETAPFRTALEAARDDLKAAFAARQLLDDDQPDDAATRKRLLGEIVSRCEEAGARLKAQTDHFEALRAIEEHAPEILAGLPAAIAAARARIPEAKRRRADLEAYAPATWASVAGNVVEAEKRLTFAAAAAERGQATLVGDQRATAGLEARTAQAALAEAGTLLDAIERLASSLDTARDQVRGEIEAAEQDLTAADGTPGTAIPAAVAQQISQARGLLDGARGALAGDRPDPLDALHQAQQANALGDDILAGIRGETERRARAKATLDAAVAAAQVALTRASDFIATRRTGVRHEARTRLAEAERHLQEAIARRSTDESGALTEARTAERLANEAYRLASHDFDRWDSGGFGGRRRGGEGELIGAVLGGILGGMIGAGRGGFGGTPWGMPRPPRGGGFGGFGGGGGVRGGGGWGGGGVRGGGRF